MLSIRNQSKVNIKLDSRNPYEIHAEQEYENQMQNYQITYIW